MQTVLHTTKNLIPRLILFAIFLCILIGVIAYARGYRFNFNEGKVTSTGILSVNSSPRAAKVFVNGELKGATDINLTLPYGQYTVEVKKDGYSSWKKQIALQGEIVMSLDARLFSKNPSLTPLTNLGIVKAIPIGNSEKLILLSQTGDVEKDGIYLFESAQPTIAIFPPLKLLALKSLLPENTDLSTASMDFAPNYRQGIITLQTDALEIAYTISLENENVELYEITSTKQNILSAWNSEKNEEIAKVIETLPKKLIQIAFDNLQIISIAPNGKRIMYRAKNDASLPLIINPPLIGANQAPEVRNLKAGDVYIYDTKEDKNYRIPVSIVIPETAEEFIIQEPAIVTDPLATSSGSIPHPTVWYPQVVRSVTEKIQWYPTSDYIAVKENNRIVLIRYDGENKETVYAGPFQNDFFGISPDWNLLVLINLNPQNNTYGDVYSVGIK